MATALTAEGKELLAKHLLGDTATAFPGCWLSLHGSQPGNTGVGQLHAMRVACALTYDSTNKWYTNASPISVPSVTGSPQWVALWPSAGSGNVRFEGQVSSPSYITGSAIIAANSLRIYATAPDANCKGGIAERGAELVLGHFLGVSSWSMPTNFRLRCHSAAPGVTGNANVSLSSATATKSLELTVGNLYNGTALYNPGSPGVSKWWSTTVTATGDALVYGEVVNGSIAWYDNTGGGYGNNGCDFGGGNDSANQLSSMRVSFDVAVAPYAGDVGAGTLIANTVASGSLTSSLLASVATAATTVVALISVGSTSIAVGTARCIVNAQIGDSAPGVKYCSGLDRIPV